MAIVFTNDRFFQTDFSFKIFENVPQASQWFKILITSRTVMPNQTGFLAKGIFDFWHMFMGLGTSTTMPLRFTCTNSAGVFAQVDVNLTVGVIYGIAVTWDGVAGHQTLWINGVPTPFGTFTGNTQDRNDKFQIGISSTAGVVYTLDDHNIWDNYVLTSTDITNLLGGTDPTTIGVSATWRGRWTLAGTTGANAAVGDAGLKNAYGGGGSRASGGDGSDFLSGGGSGTAVYAPTLVWVPTVTADPVYIDTSGKVAVVFFKSLVNGSQVTPSQLLQTPTITVNGVSHGALGTPWFTGYHPFAWYPLPAGLQVTPTDTVTLSAPTAWANTPAGSVAAMNNLAAANRVGKSVVRPDNYIPTLPVGTNNPNNPMTIFGFFNPLKNWKYRTYGGKDKYSGAGEFAIYANVGNNGIDSTNEPGPPGLWLVMWDTAAPSNTNQFGIKTPTPGTTSITERVDLKASPGSGIGMCRVFDVEHVSLTGSADLSINLLITGPVNYSNLWIVAPGDFTIVNGAVVLDRTDPWALGGTYLSRVPQNVGSLRWVDGTIGGNPGSLPYPEALRDLTWESWGDLAFVRTTPGYSAVGPINTTTTPWIYSPHFGKPGAQGQTFTATLASAITTTPASGTQETYTFSDAATAPLMAGLEIKIDAEIMRLISVSGTSVVVNRGSNGTTPATHAAGTVTVYGRTPITVRLAADGSQFGSYVWQLTTAAPHGMTTGSIMSCDGSGWPTITFENGATFNLQGAATFAYVTGPTTFYMRTNAAAGKSNGGILAAAISLTPSSQYWDRRWPGAATMPHEACAIVTGKFPNANLHVNIWPDACDDMVYEIARRVLANFPAGRKLYIEYDNEPWNFDFTGFYYHVDVMGPMIVPGFPVYPADHQHLVHYAFRAFQVHAIFRSVFATAGRANEIMGILNCQMSAIEQQDHLNYAVSTGHSVEAVAIAPYVSTEGTALNATVFDRLDDEQAISMFVHDLWYNSNTNWLNGWITANKNMLAAYNANSSKTGGNAILMGYEGGIEFVYPYAQISNTTFPGQRNHDCVTNPNWYIAEQDFYAWLQMYGFDHLHLYGLAMYWGPNTAAWGLYHGILQDHGRGDGSDGKLNNLLCRANPNSAHYKGGNVNQDLNTVSVRGQAFIDWLGAMGTVPPAGTYSFGGPTTGTVGVATGSFVVTPGEIITGTITATPSGAGMTGADAVTLTWSAAQNPQSFTLTPRQAGTLTLTLTNTAGLTNLSPFTCTITNLVTLPRKYVLRRWG